jgi:hypothetical protein
MNTRSFRGKSRQARWETSDTFPKHLHSGQNIWQQQGESCTTREFQFVTPDQGELDGRECSTYKSDEKNIQKCLETPKGTGLLEYLGVEERTILK